MSEDKSTVTTHFELPPGKGGSYDPRPITLEVEKIIGRRSTQKGDVLTLELSDGSVRQYLESFIVKPKPKKKTRTRRAKKSVS